MAHHPIIDNTRTVNIAIRDSETRWRITHVLCRLKLARPHVLPTQIQVHTKLNNESIFIFHHLLFISGFQFIFCELKKAIKYLSAYITSVSCRNIQNEKRGGFSLSPQIGRKYFILDRMIGSVPTMTRRMPTDLRRSLSDAQGTCYFSPQEYKCLAKLSTAELVQFR